MAPLPVDNTARYVIRYNGAQNEHSLLVRTADSVNATEVGTAVDAVLTALDPNLWALSVLDAIFYAKNSNVSVPVTTGIEGNTYGTGIPSVLDEPNYIDFVGRSAGGRRNKLTIFGPTDLGGNYRVNVGEFGSIQDVLDVLENTPGIFVAIDGGDCFWKQYANTGTNSYWQKEMRG